MGQKDGNFWDTFTGDGMLGTAAAIGSGLFDNWNSEQQQQDQMELMDHQTQNQQTLNQQQAAIQGGLNQQGHDLQMQMWENTNAPAQVGMLREAGLNPALMYKQGAPGGTTGSQTGGSAQGGSAAGGNAMQRRQLMEMNNLMMGAQLDNLKANTKKTKAEAENEEGGKKDVLNAQYKKLIADKEFQKQLKKTEVEKTEVERLKKEAEQMNVDSMNTAGWTEGDAIWVKSAKQYANTLVEGGKMTVEQAKEWLAEVVQEFFEDGPVTYDPNNPNHEDKNNKEWKSFR